jgi:transglutaminase-like putative cysteine protease
MRIALPILVAAAWLNASVVLSAEVSSGLDPSQPYQAQRTNPVTYQVDLRIIVTPPAKTKRLQVWLPLPESDFGQEIRDRELETFPQSVEPRIATDERFGNTFAWFDFANPPGAQQIRHNFQAKVWELRWQLDPERITPVEEWPAAFDRYRRSETQAVVVNREISQLLEQIVPRRTNPLNDMAAVLAWVNGNFQYDHSQASLAASSLHGLTRRRGHCSDYHGFCASLGRAMGYPTRITYGLHAFEKTSPSHCKLEVFLPPYGWVSFDVSETQRQVAAIRGDQQLSASQRDRFAAAAQQRLLSGFRDNTWFVQTHGSDYELVPPASRRVSVVRTIYAEADGVPLPDPDPSNPNQREFAWMTVAQFKADRMVEYPYQGIAGLTPNDE